MEIKVKIYKKEGTYFSTKDNKDKHYTNFYIACNDDLIPVEVKYFPNPAFNDRDPGYSARFAVLSAFAEPLPEKEKKDIPESTPTASAVPASAESTSAPESEKR